MKNELNYREFRMMDDEKDKPGGGGSVGGGGTGGTGGGGTGSGGSGEGGSGNG